MPGQFFFAWVAVMSLWTFLLFGFDKWRAGRKSSQRIAESSLLFVSALGGWPGGLLAIALLRHKSAKPSFLLKFAVSFVIWAALALVAWRRAFS